MEELGIGGERGQGDRAVGSGSTAASVQRSRPEPLSELTEAGSEGRPAFRQVGELTVDVVELGEEGVAGGELAGAHGTGERHGLSDAVDARWA